MSRKEWSRISLDQVKQYEGKTQRSPAITILLDGVSYLLSVNTELFSPREIEVLAMMLCGYSNQNIANELTITLGTVKNHVHNIYAVIPRNPRRQKRDILLKQYLLEIAQLIPKEQTESSKKNEIQNSLTEVEAQVYALIRQKKSIQEISTTLGINSRQIFKYFYLILRQIAENFDK